MVPNIMAIDNELYLQIQGKLKMQSDDYCTDSHHFFQNIQRSVQCNNCENTILSTQNLGNCNILLRLPLVWLAQPLIQLTVCLEACVKM